MKVSKEETLAESCEVTKRVNRYLQQVENQTPAPRVWSSLPGTSASLGTSVVEVKKKSNLELIKSETLFVPDQSHQCTLCAKTFASEARLVAHQVQQHFVILMISAFFFQLYIFLPSGIPYRTTIPLLKMWQGIQERGKFEVPQL